MLRGASDRHHIVLWTDIRGDSDSALAHSFAALTTDTYARGTHTKQQTASRRSETDRSESMRGFTELSDETGATRRTPTRLDFTSGKAVTLARLLIWRLLLLRVDIDDEEDEDETE